jgi:lysyl-tRNA synthetase class 2
LRARLYALIRTFFAERQVLEVETPILSSAGQHRSQHPELLDAPWPHDDERWLRTSPEFALKRLLAAGVGDCYELGRVFRDGEAGPPAQSRVHDARVVSRRLGPSAR